MDWGRGPIASQQPLASTSSRFCVPLSLWSTTGAAEEKPKSRGCVDSLYAFAGFPPSYYSGSKQDDHLQQAPGPRTPPQSEGGQATPPDYGRQDTIAEEEDYGWEAETSAAAAQRAEKKRLTRAKEAAVRCFGAMRPACTRGPTAPSPQPFSPGGDTPRAGQGPLSQQQYAADPFAPIVVYR